MFPPILPPFPQTPRTLSVRQIECARCREIFTIAEDNPTQLISRTDNWHVPHTVRDEMPATALRFNTNLDEVEVMPEIRAEPLEQPGAVGNWHLEYYLNCPRCGADNRNWLFVSTQIRPYFARNVLIGGVISLIWIAYVLVNRWEDFLPDRLLATICLFLAAFLPLRIIPGQWRALREFLLSRRFLPALPQPRFSAPVVTAVILYLIFVWGIPVMRYGFMPLVKEAVPAIVQAAGDSGNDEKDSELGEELEFLADWLYLGTLTSLIASIFAVSGVQEVLGRVNNQLPRPIFANAANMVRVALWEARRALEIDHQIFERIQWTLTRVNEVGGIDMEGYFRDRPDFLANGRLDDFVRVQKYKISTDRWCVITRASIADTRAPRAAGGSPPGGWRHGR